MPQIVHKILGIYKRLDKEAKAFANFSSITCPEGCGGCCDRADTEISECEALVIAHFLRSKRRELIPTLLRRDHQKNRIHGEQPCVFYAGDTSLHCRIYPVRPPICRCYGYSAERNRSGMLYFPLCSYMELSPSLKSGGSMLRILFEPYPPVMADYRDEIEAVPGRTEDTRLLPLADAVERALRETRQ